MELRAEEFTEVKNIGAVDLGREYGVRKEKDLSFKTKKKSTFNKCS